MASKPERRYWDAATCLAYLLAEEGRVEECQLVLDAAERGEVELVISALTIAEVLNLRGRGSIPQQQSAAVRAFFRRTAFLVVNVDRFIAEAAQEVVWHHGVRPKDAVHVATALAEQVTVLETYDTNLISKDLQVGGNPPLRILRPGSGLQTDLNLGASGD